MDVLPIGSPFLFLKESQMGLDTFEVNEIHVVHYNCLGASVPAVTLSCMGSDNMAYITGNAVPGS
jgi:hypothetical protein